MNPALCIPTGVKEKVKSAVVCPTTCELEVILVTEIVPRVKEARVDVTVVASKLPSLQSLEYEVTIFPKDTSE